MAGDPDKDEVRHSLERSVENYFLQLRLPDEPTVYDHLLLSLRSKDVVATFNWDPFLTQAARRVEPATKSLPHLLFLHGNVAHGYCVRDAISGVRGAACSRCGDPFIPDRLLYPVATKDYSTDPSIAAAWVAMRNALQNALLVTIFGYGAPSSDRDAVALMSGAWGSPETREFEQIELIDLRPEAELRNTWSRFIHTHHYECHGTWQDSFLAQHPRRSAEAFVNQIIEAQFIAINPAPHAGTFKDLVAWHNPLLAAEQRGG